MIKTDHEGVEMVSKGILVMTKNDTSYERERAKYIEAQRTSDRINNVEQRITNIEDMLAKILQKVSQ